MYFVFFSNAPLKFQTYRKSKDWHNECPHLYHLDLVVNILTYLLQLFTQIFFSELFIR